LSPPSRAGSGAVTSSVTIRDAALDDLPRVVALLQELSLDEPREQSEGPLLESYVSAFHHIEANPRHRLLVAEDEGRVVGIDMLAEMLARSRAAAAQMGLANVEFREGLIEDMPVEDGWADVVMSNGVINLCADKRGAFQEIWRVLRPGGWLQFADIANGKPVPESALRNIDLWTA